MGLLPCDRQINSHNTSGTKRLAPIAARSVSVVQAICVAHVSIIVIDPKSAHFLGSMSLFQVYICSRTINFIEHVRSEAIL